MKNSRKSPYLERLYIRGLYRRMSAMRRMQLGFAESAYAYTRNLVVFLPSSPRQAHERYFSKNHPDTSTSRFSLPHIPSVGSSGPGGGHLNFPHPAKIPRFGTKRLCSHLLRSIDFWTCEIVTSAHSAG